jgi:hypothetical protein
VLSRTVDMRLDLLARVMNSKAAMEDVVFEGESSGMYRVELAFTGY